MNRLLAAIVLVSATLLAQAGEVATHEQLREHALLDRDGRAAGPGPGAGLRPVRRDDAADRLLLHVLVVRQQHGLRLS
jgi:hypothetical protein